MKKYLSPLLLLAALALPSAVPTDASAQRVDPVYVEDRLNQLQQAITVLTGQLEQMQYKNSQLQSALEKMQADYEFRIDQLEKGGGRAGPGPGPARPPAPGPATAPPRPPGPAAGPAPPPGPQTTLAPPVAGADQLYHDAFKMFQEGDYAGAERAFRTFQQRNPQHALAGNAQYWLGETYYARRDYQNAMTAFAEGYKNYKTSQKGPDILLKLGVTLAAMGRKQDACTMFARFNQDYPRAGDLLKRRVDYERQRSGCG